MNDYKTKKLATVKTAAVIATLLAFILTLSACNAGLPESQVNNGTLTETENSPLTYTLPSPELESNTSLEETLASRRSRRSFQDKAISAQQLSQILWASYGVTSAGGLRTAPSAGALYPLEIYAVIGNVEGITPGVYRYISNEHKIVMTIDGDIRAELSEAALGQRMVRDAPVSIFYSAVFERTTGRYGDRGNNYVYIEVGHSAQNIYLQAESLGLGTCAIGAFTDERVKQLLKLPPNEDPLYLMPIGHVAGYS
jgi:SagB-type dehydrogenase family enzyme